ncbi:SYF2 splicing factor-domain-containing protein [Lophiotrema nucula]|uniref:Pre-mRNA-splicing factor SYF2 n=1 Tax=Lophiotrema nucula TaxID=690887 RepID=A0A6A5ZQ95_9PLEO|nr:SYF2 splicing factor-domain-containing protein [Lophiotrema nucula]
MPKPCSIERIEAEGQTSIGRNRHHVADYELVDRSKCFEPQDEPSEPAEAPAPAVTDPKAALAARMARFKSLQSTKAQTKIDNSKAQIAEQKKESSDQQHKQLQQLEEIKVRTDVKIIKDEEGDNYERKRAWDRSAEESEQWDKRVKRKKANKDKNAFSDWRAEANKNYKRQLKQMGKVDLDAYLAEKAQKLQNQVSSGLLELVETADGDVFTVDKEGRINTPVDEAYTHGDHRPSKDAVDRLVSDLDKAERARLKARAARGGNDDDKGDVTYINQKNKQFNDKLARFYNRYTTEIRESFERGTAI